MKNLGSKTTSPREIFRLTVFLFIALLAFTSASKAADGDLDTTFGTNGIVTTSLNFMDGKSMVIQPDGKIVIGSNARVTLNSPTGGDFGLARFNSRPYAE